MFRFNLNIFSFSNFLENGERLGEHNLRSDDENLTLVKLVKKVELEWGAIQTAHSGTRLLPCTLTLSSLVVYFCRTDLREMRLMRAFPETRGTIPEFLCTREKKMK